MIPEEGAEITGRKVSAWLMFVAFGDRAWYEGNHLLRAAGAMGGWGGNDLAEAAYPGVHEDADGEPPHGDRRYRLTLASPTRGQGFGPRCSSARSR